MIARSTDSRAVPLGAVRHGLPLEEVAGQGAEGLLLLAEGQVHAYWPCLRRSAPGGRVSALASEFLCTSSGPSAKRRVRIAGERRGEREVLREPAGAVGLDGPVDDLLDHLAGVAILIAWISVCAPWLPTVSISQAVFRTSSRSCSTRDPGLGDPLADHALARQRPAERDPALDPLAHQLDGPLGHADRAHAVVDAARAEPGLGDARSRRPPRRSGSPRAPGRPRSSSSAWPPCWWSS